jgi:hypothetical protein
MKCEKHNTNFTYNEKCSVCAMLERAASLEADTITLSITEYEQLISLLKEARHSLCEGLESDVDMEAEWSVSDKDLISRIDQAIAKDSHENN